MKTFFNTRKVKIYHEILRGFTKYCVSLQM